MNTDTILAERESRYGNYINQTQISSALIRVMQEALLCREKALASDQNDALVMIAIKISRIINGDPNYLDNWSDIAGYATLVAQRLQSIAPAFNASASHDRDG